MSDLPCNSVEKIDLNDQTALMSSEEMLPVVSWWDRGEQTEDPYEATECVAGPDSGGFWYTITVGGETVPYQ